MALLIQQRVRSGGELSRRVNPTRIAPDVGLVALITRKCTDQRGKCALCGGPLVATTNKMLQPSPDRIDSNNVAYDDANMQITHLACRRS
jgi:hypothetical protein